MDSPFSATRFLAMARKEALQLRRDPRSLLLAFAVPVLLLIIFGYAITWDIRDIRTAVLDRDNSARSRELIDHLRSSGYFTITQRLDRPEEIGQLMDRDAILMAIVIPPDFSRDLGSQRPAVVQAIVDGSDANTATIALGYVEAVVQAWSNDIRLRGRVLQPSVRAESRVWFNEELLSRNMIVPGLVAVIMMIIAAMLTSLTIAREWERGTMEQLASTPVSRIEVILGKLVPYVIIGVIDIVMTVVLGIVVFHVPFRGDPLLLLVLSFLFLVGALGLGIFISAVTRSQVLATQVAMVVTYLPSLLLSGFMFSIDAMPRALRAITYLVPARYYLVVTRGIFLKGVGISVLRVQALLMVAFAVVGLTLAVASFHKEIE
ncbi:MAG TPA: ABC transporter permease [Thermoanaerobaculia bacterium]|nr:ABC transporter permease [Thermoanaerobaculia bacterium]